MGSSRGAPWHFLRSFCRCSSSAFALLPGCVGGPDFVCWSSTTSLDGRKQVLLLAGLAVVIFLALAAYQISRATQRQNWKPRRRHGPDRQVSSSPRRRCCPVTGCPRACRRRLQGNLVGSLDRGRRALLPGVDLEQRPVSCTCSPPGPPCTSTRRGHNRVATGGALRAALRRAAGSTRASNRLLPFLDPQTAPAHHQGLPHLPPRPVAVGRKIAIFAGLMTLYFTNIHKLYVRDIGWSNRNWISLLNLGRHVAALVYVHEPIHLPDAQPGGAEVLDPRPVAVAGASGCCGASFAFSATGGALHRRVPGDPQ